LRVQTERRSQLVNITPQVQELLGRSEFTEGIALISVPHTTCALAVNEDEEGLKEDVLQLLSRLVPEAGPYEHNKVDNNAHAHLRSLLQLPYIALPISAGKLQLGSWQSLFLVEWDGPRQRMVLITLMGDVANGGKSP